MLDTCGFDDRLERMPSDAVSTTLTNFGRTVSLGPTRATASGGMYRMCWCASSSECSGGPVDFIVDSGTLHYIGPHLYQKQECIPGLLCSFDDFRGYGLVDGDSMMALVECGTGDAILGFPNNGISNGATKDGMRFGWGDGGAEQDFLPLATDTPGGLYRMCWCPGELEACEETNEFRVDAGDFYIRGPHAQVSTSCAAGQSCSLGPWTGTDLYLRP